MTEVVLRRDQFLELQKIGIGALAPLSGFMNEDDFHHSVHKLRLADGRLFPLPVYLDVTTDMASAIRGRPRVTLTFEGVAVGEIEPQNVFRWEREDVARAVFGVSEREHPGVAKMYSDHEWLVGGPIKLHDAGRRFLFAGELSPAETKAIFKSRGWKTIAGFQTRNVPHRAHEYLQRIALELSDGLFVQPLLGRKKVGDYTPEAIMSGYQTLIGRFLPADRVVLGVLSTAMRYAGPREALFHAIIRRNYGCTHFVIGRDHAGVQSYYGKYDAHALARQFAGELDIAILALAGPFFCRLCDGIATENSCPHVTTQPDAITEISGTMMRQILSGAETPHPNLMRPEIVASVSGKRLFVEEDDQ